MMLFGLRQEVHTSAANLGGWNVMTEVPRVLIISKGSIVKYDTRVYLMSE
jgi:hypothetical protein